MSMIRGGAANLASRVRMELDDARAAGAFSAAAVAIAVAGETNVVEAVGELAVVDDAGAPIPAENRERADKTTLFDLASVTKVYSAHTLLRLVEAGALALDEPIGTWLPAYRNGLKRTVTLRHLLTHTSGLPASWDGWRAPLARLLMDHPDAIWHETPLTDREGLRADLEETPLQAEPGNRWEYACTGFNTAMLVAEQATGRPWEDLLHAETLDPLGLTETTARPVRQRVAATEWQPELRRGTIRGVVHDESSWSLGGGTANAGLFASVTDVLAFAEAIRVGRSEPMKSLMWEDQLGSILGSSDSPGHPGFGASLGLRIGETSWMGRSAASVRGHTGFTGTSIAMDRQNQSTIALLTNRVHPSRVNDGVHRLRGRIVDIIREQF